VPTYDYQCDACRVTYELRQGFDAESSHTCEECGKGVARRVLTAPRVVFKGSGWYVTDSRKGSSGDSSSKSADSAESSESSTASDKPSNDKPAKESTPAASSSKSSGESAAAG
jgi:putative FmdB family regulatory protein